MTASHPAQILQKLPLSLWDAALEPSLAPSSIWPLPATCTQRPAPPSPQHTPFLDCCPLADAFPAVDTLFPLESSQFPSKAPSQAFHPGGLLRGLLPNQDLSRPLHQTVSALREGACDPTASQGHTQKVPTEHMNDFSLSRAKMFDSSLQLYFPFLDSKPCLAREEARQVENICLVG